MEKAIEKASALIEAMAYIRSFRDRMVVVKLGGSILEDLDLQKKLLTDVVFMATVGMRPMIVHGGGKAITKAMADAGLEPVWVHGRRYTDQRTLAIAEHTLIHKINTPICNTIEELGCKAMGLHSLSSCVVFAEPLHMQGEDGRKIDLGLVGKVSAVNAELLATVCNAGVIPVIATIGCTKTGGKLNINADSVAGKVAAAVKAEKLVVLSDTHGILTDMNNPESRISSASESEIEKMIADGIITSGMRPKVEACITALEGGAKKAHIIDGRIPHSLLLEIYTDKGIGTQIIK
ncbi:MAG TPA: acetylglutamate kinase [Anaerohalosphaeraceae bacterium]|jgi:acetylglutamate kinase|nr:acetylglutamate kinase [Anaerohalosphaeraceae bacterium]HRT49392.1 acetylglutamate kinase [Anaerohalosphaeraceae bacterium]HRT87385.1 acetylglutamate kinase [Anaerohalosphaeraceae bacterium]